VIAMTKTSVKEMPGMRIRRSWLALLGAAAAIALAAPAAQAADTFGIDTFTTTVTSDQAGGHPDLTTVVDFNIAGDGSPAGRDKDLTVALPQGFLGNPQNVPVCHLGQLLGANQCAPETQVGVITLVFDVFGSLSPFTLPMYHVDTQPGHAATFATVALIPTVIVNADIGPAHGYQLTTSLRSASEGIPLAGSSLTFWGVPADASHDGDRGGPADSPREPFLTYPANCGSGLTATADVTSWEAPDTHVTATTGLPAPTNCEALSINPTLTVAPSTSQADSPAGYSVTTELPQETSPDEPATPALKTVAVNLPQGVALAPPGADGLAVCTEDQLGPSSDTPAACPDAAKIGKVEIDTPLQAQPLEGSLYFGAGTSSDDPFRIFMVASGPGTLIKLVADVTADKNTGQLKTVFDNLPQLPFNTLTLTFFGGPRAVLANPQSCGTFTATSAMAAWSGQTASPQSQFPINGCASPLPFAPDFVAGMTDNHAGGSGALTIQFGRKDGEQNLSSLKVDLPPGLLAHLGSVTPCGEAQVTAKACPDSSQVGTASVAAGSGDHPLWLTGGKTYLTGPYRGAPFGLAIIVPAVAGPLNLGTELVRQAISINPDDAHVTVTSDAFPTIVGGIPLRLRRLAVTIDRAGFLVNPTNCDPLTIAGVVTSTAGATAAVSAPFHVGSCADLGFTPKLAMKLTGKSQTKNRKHPGLVATVTPLPGQANIRTTTVTLPASVTLDANHLPVQCELADAQKRACPASSAVGSATVRTPLVNAPLTGPVYLVKGATGGLPSLLAALSGPIDISVHADSAFTGRRIVTKFTGLPDAPLSSFVLTINGGSKGILMNTRNLCSKKSTARFVLGAQNGRTRSATVRAAVTCPKKKAKKKAT
jgi:hypothetical protein